MKSITLRNLPKDVLVLIDETAVAEGLEQSAAVVKLLDDIAIERIIEHDIEIMQSWIEEDEFPEPAVPVPRERCCCCHHRCAS